MATLHVGSLDVVYEDRRAAARFAPVLRAMLEEGLASALDEAGLDPGEQVCIRELEVPVRLDAGATDSALVAAWSRAIAAAVRTAREARSPAGQVVCWRSPRHARLDLLVSFAAGEASRAWAWRRAGLLPPGRGGPRPEEVVQTLAAAPREIVALLVAAARQGLWPRLARLFPRGAWRTLCAAALEAHGVSADALAAAMTLPPAEAETPTSAAALHDLAQRSRLAEAAVAGGVARTDAEATVSLAALVLLECDPARLAAPDRAQAIASLARILGTAAGLPRDVSSADAPARASGGNAARDQTARVTAPHFATAYGGLLYLLHLVSAEGLPATLRREPRGLRWWVHAVGCVLANAPERDPAVLAFAGLAPDAEPPSSRLPLPTEEERDRCQALASALQTRLGGLVEADPIGLGELIARPAEVRAEPGWIELRLPLAAVDTRIRRAGLDLDPDFVPWLGCVVRFSYV